MGLWQSDGLFMLSSILQSRPVSSALLLLLSLVISTQEEVIRHMLTHRMQECGVRGKYAKLFLFC